ncbi:MAG: SEC-C metal-binding domain-containing protein, partial [bacterium]
GIKEGEAIEHKMITNSVERAQKKVEENNYAIRKRLLEYDNVMNQQREVIYAKRRQALMGERLKDEIFEMVDKAVDAIVKKHFDEGNIQGLIDEVQRTFLVRVEISPEEFQKLGEGGMKNMIMEETKSFYDRKEERYGADLMGQVERFSMLSIIDEKWKEHLREMDDLKEGINFRAYGQKDPLLEYKTDGFKLFVEMLDTLSMAVINMIFKFTTQSPEEAKNVRTPMQTNTSRLRTYHQSSEGMGYIGGGEPSDVEDPNAKQQPIKVSEKIGRNDPCFCGSGKKFKNCHGRISKEAVI